MVRALQSLIGLAGFVIVIACWYVVSLLGLAPNGLLPLPYDVLVKLWQAGILDLLVDAYASVKRVVIGLVIGVAIAIPIGFLLAQSRILSRIFHPVINFARALPPIALIPLVVLYFGIGEGARLLVMVAAAFFPALVVIFEEVRGINKIYIRAGQTLGTSNFESFYRIILPLSVPGIMTALRVSLGIAWATVVAAELIAAQKGLGAYIQNASNFFQIANIIGGILLIGTLAVIMDRILAMVQKRVLRWRASGS